jgi:hypothetical protein
MMAPHRRFAIAPDCGRKSVLFRREESGYAGWL